MTNFFVYSGHLWCILLWNEFAKILYFNSILCFPYVLSLNKNVTKLMFNMFGDQFVTIATIIFLSNFCLVLAVFKFYLLLRQTDHVERFSLLEITADSNLYLEGLLTTYWGISVNADLFFIRSHYLVVKAGHHTLSLSDSLLPLHLMLAWFCHDIFPCAYFWLGVPFSFVLCVTHTHAENAISWRFTTSLKRSLPTRKQQHNMLTETHPYRCLS